MRSVPTIRHERTLDQRWIGAAQLVAFADAQTDAHRLCSAQDGWIERFGGDVLISYKTGEALKSLRAGFAAWSGDRGFAARRIFGRFLPIHNEERAAPVLLEAVEDLPLESVVQENGVRYGIDFAGGYSRGLFIDQRANRLLVRQTKARRFLNTFAYTCSFSVVAALAGAETVSMDLSKKSLDRGRANFALNELNAANHRFIAGDVLEVLPRMARRGEQYDGIILDPPTFSRNAEGKRFHALDDFEKLLSMALDVAAPHARLLLSTNCARLTERQLEQMGRHCLKLARKSATFHRESELPDVPGTHSARTIWMRLA